LGIPSAENGEKREKKVDGTKKAAVARGQGGLYLQKKNALAGTSADKNDHGPSGAG
jgi:hypothetical protein